MLVISLSSIPPRFDKLRPTLECLIRQTAQVDRIILYIPKSYRRFPDYSGHSPEVPDGVEIHQTEVDYGPATKVLAAALEFRGQDCDILFCDDDRLYPPDWAAVFVKERRSHPDACIAPVARHAKELFDSKQIRTQHPRAVQRPWITDIWFILRYAIFKLQNETLEGVERPTRLVIKTAGYTDLFMGFGGVLVRPEHFDAAAYDATKLPLTVWFAAIHLIVTAKNGISSVELGRRLGVKQPTAWAVKHKIMAVMARREGETALTGRVEMDDAYLGGVRSGGKRGRGAAGKTPFVAAVSTSPEGRPRKLKLAPVKGFRKREIARGAKHWLAPGAAVVTDGLGCWSALDEAACSHQAIRTGSGRQAARMASFKWVNTTLGNIKSAITGTYRKLGPDHAGRYLASFGPEIVKPRQQFEPTSAGVFDMNWSTNTYYMGTTSVPFPFYAMPPDPPRWHSSGVWAYLDKDYARHGQKLIALIGGGTKCNQFHIMLKRPFDPATSFKGWKIRANAFYKDIVNPLGGSMVNLDPGEIYGGLQKGVVDGAAWPTIGALNFKWYEVAKYMLRPRFGCTITTVTMNLKSFNMLTSKQRNVMVSEGKKLEVSILAEADKMQEAELVKLKQLGVEETWAEKAQFAKLVRSRQKGLWELAMVFNKRSAPYIKELREIARKAGLAE